jgi:hypothetical protein
MLKLNLENGRLAATTQMAIFPLNCLQYIYSAGPLSPAIHNAIIFSKSFILRK